MIDSVWMLSVSIDRETPAQRTDSHRPSPENPLSRDQDFMAWHKWSHDLHMETSTWQTGNRREYRHDIQNPDDSAVRIHITYVFGWFTPAEQKEDEAAITRIIKSVKPLQKEKTQQQN
jgi:hypothetical protein